MIRMSQLRNTPVILGEHQIGIFQSMLFDQTRKRVCAFVISGGMRGKKIVSVQHICALGEDFVLVDGWCRYRRSDKQQIAPFVRDTTGLLVGRVTDYAIDKKTWEVIAVEVLSGYLPHDWQAKSWMYEYCFAADSDELCTPSVLYNQPSFSGEEYEACGCPP